MFILAQKKCRSCGVTKPLSEFTKDKKSRDGFRYSCSECRKTQAREYYNLHKEKYIENANNWKSNNIERVRDIQKKCRAKNAEKNSLYSRIYNLFHKEQNKQKSSRWYQANKERASENRKKWRAENPEKNNEWRRRNPEKAVIYEQNRRARVLGNGGTYVLSEWIELCEKYDNKCLCCGRSDVKLTADHILPISLGGYNSIDNIQPLCVSCNSKKGAKHVDYRGSK